MGQLFSQYFSYSGYAVTKMDIEDWPKAAEIMADADVLIFSVPINITLKLMDEIAPYLTENMLLMDLTSTKQAPLTKMCEIHKGAVLGLHPMFGPDIPNMEKQLVVCCQGRFPERYQWVLEQLQLWGAKLHQISAKEHDQAMSYIQAVRHFATYANGLHLSKQPIELAQLMKLSSPIYRLELAMIGRLFAQNAELYADIIMDKAENLTAIEDLKQCYEEGLAYFYNKDKEGFIQSFNRVREWFGEYSEQFLQESQQLLQKSNEARK